MKTKITIEKQEDNSFVIVHEKETIGKLFLDPKYRGLARVFEIAPSFIRIINELKELLENVEPE